MNWKALALEELGLVTPDYVIATSVQSVSGIDEWQVDIVVSKCAPSDDLVAILAIALVSKEMETLVDPDPHGRWEVDVLAPADFSSGSATYKALLTSISAEHPAVWSN